MKLPRNESAEGLIRKLSKFGYSRTRQVGSHIRLSREAGGKTDHLTIPNHDPLRIGTFSDILKEVSGQLEMSKEELIKKLYL